MEREHTSTGELADELSPLRLNWLAGPPGSVAPLRVAQVPMVATRLQRCLAPKGAAAAHHRLWIASLGWLAIGMVSLSGCMSPPTMKVPAPSAASVGGNGFDRSAIAKPLTPERPVLPEIARERVVWLGIATTVVDSEVPERFPILSQAQETNASVSSIFVALDKQIQSRLAGQPKYPGFNLIGQTEEQRPSDVGMALLINKERWRQEKVFEENYRWEYGILGQLVFIDQQKQEICGSYPLGFRLSQVTQSPPTHDQVSDLARRTLLEQEGGTSKANCLLSLFMEALQSTRLSIRSDYCFEVGSVRLDPQCATPTLSNAEMKPVGFDSHELALWESELGPVLVNHLGNGSGMVMNPYVAKAGGKDNILALHFLKEASRVVQAGVGLSLRLRPPVRRFDLQIKNLNCTKDSEWSGQYVVNLIFGFDGVLSETEPVTGRTVLAHSFDVSLNGFKGLPKGLRETYWRNARRKLLPSQFESGEYDSRWCWRNSIENFLDQISSEMLFELADRGGRFALVRADLTHITHSLTHPNQP